MPHFDKTEFSFLIVRPTNGVLQGVLGPRLHPPPARPLINIHDGLFYRFSFLALLPVALSIVLIELEIPSVCFSLETQVTKGMLRSD
jgi:hypothetical protein